MSNHYLIRRARRCDLNELLRLESWFHGDRISRRGFLYLLRHGHADLLVAEGTNTLIGNVVILYRRNSSKAYLYSIVVDQSARGQGIGRALLNAGELAARDYGRTSMVLEVREDNDSAQNLYHRADYHKIGRVLDYYDDGIAALRMSKLISSTLFN
ncbi:(ribosomal protein S18)-alanine N-acetyltransferase [Gammaproteobacteria bacterium]